jgi:hypothetical protein
MLNVLLPFSEDKTAMILFHLDMKGIAVSEGAPARVGSIKFACFGRNAILCRFKKAKSAHFV